jgi:ribosomal protein L7/L12
MFVPWWIIALTIVLLLVLGDRALRRSSGEMLAEQRRAGAMPNVEHRAVLAEPEISAALAKGETITAIRLVRKRTGLGLREAKELIERATH